MGKNGCASGSLWTLCQCTLVVRLLFFRGFFRRQVGSEQFSVLRSLDSNPCWKPVLWPPCRNSSLHLLGKLQEIN